MTESKFTSSIARQINMNFWFRQFFIFILMDMLMILLTAGVFFQWDIRKICDWDNLTTLKALFLENKYLPIIILVFQALVLFDGIFQTRKIRRVMRPLNEMAKKAQELGNIAFDPEKFSSLEDAISHIQPDSPDAMLATGDKDLKSLEVAINNLLERMRRIYRQQNQFVSDASHELRTPIAVIQGYVNMLDRWGKDDEEILNESIEALKNESQHMKELVEQLLFLARGDCGRNTLKKETLNLTDIIRQVCEESEMIDEHHKYHFKGSEELLMEGDLSMLKQSVRIFTDNAAKYSEEGHTIVLAAGRNESGIYYSVQDEGTGIEEKDVSHVFDRFYRSDEARNSKKGGTGLGLSIAHWIVEAHDGVIEIISRPGLGTRFTVRFPKQK